MSENTLEYLLIGIKNDKSMNFFNGEILHFLRKRLSETKPRGLGINDDTFKKFYKDQVKCFKREQIKNVFFK